MEDNMATPAQEMERRFWSAGGGQTIGRGRPARRVAPDPQVVAPGSSFNSRQYNAIAGGILARNARSKELDRRNKLDEQALQNKGSLDVQGLSNQGGLEKQGLVNQGAMARTVTDNEGAMARQQAVVGGQRDVANIRAETDRYGVDNDPRRIGTWDMKEVSDGRGGYTQMLVNDATAETRPLDPNSMSASGQAIGRYSEQADAAQQLEDERMRMIIDSTVLEDDAAAGGGQAAAQQTTQSASPGVVERVYGDSMLAGPPPAHSPTPLDRPPHPWSREAVFGGQPTDSNSKWSKKNMTPGAQRMFGRLEDRRERFSIKRRDDELRALRNKLAGGGPAGYTTR